MQVEKTGLEGVLQITPDVYADRRGYFMETFNERRYREHGINVSFVQDNLSFSKYNTLRGLHFQYPFSQAKLVHVLRGKVFDVVVDIRKGSPTFGKWYGTILSDENYRQLFIPAGFAHGFCTLSETALFSYKCDEFYKPDCESGIIWDDPDIGIKWPITDPLLSKKDRGYSRLTDLDDGYLPKWESRQNN